MYKAEEKTIAVLIRGDHDVNEVKLAKLLGVTEVEMATPEKVKEITGAPLGFAGPMGLTNVRILADHAVKGMKNFVVGANRTDTHYVDANWERDFTVDQFADIRNAQTGDMSPRGEGTLTLAKGIEVGQVFLLGTKYSKSMNATILDDQGKERLAIMGCYGIGVGRTAAAAVEQNHDEKGIIWPFPIAPFHVHLLPLGQSATVTEATTNLYTALQQAGLEVLWDDRDERAGVKFNDADLIGAPFQVIVGDKSLAEGLIEVKIRRSGEKLKIVAVALPTKLLQLASTTPSS